MPCSETVTPPYLSLPQRLQEWLELREGEGRSVRNELHVGPDFPRWRLWKQEGARLERLPLEPPFGQDHFGCKLIPPALGRLIAIQQDPVARPEQVLVPQ